MAGCFLLLLLLLSLSLLLLLLLRALAAFALVLGFAAGLASFDLATADFCAFPTFLLFATLKPPPMSSSRVRSIPSASWHQATGGLATGASQPAMAGNPNQIN